jgi:arylsulfatase A-like enzyme
MHSSLPLTGAATLLSILPASLAASPLPDPAPRPNVVFIMVDDMGYGDVGVYGQTEIRTPRIDQLAAEGMRFSQAYAGSPICAPSRSVLMTGQHAGTTRIRGNFSLPGFGVQDADGQWRLPLAPEDLTVAEVLKGAGYATGATGKWGLGEEGTTGIPTLQGFDEWYGLLNQRQAHSHYPAFMLRDTVREYLPGNTGTDQDFATEAHYAQDLFTAFALDFIDRHAGGDAPFFLYLPFTIPHDAFQIPELEPYTTGKPWSMQEKVYASMLTRLDREIGRIMDRLAERGIDNDTLVFFCSDNGAANRYDGRFDSSGELRGRKRDLYDGGIRTVMIARWPGTVAAGAVSDAIWYFPDVLPTLAELAGTPAPQGVDGVSIVPTLLSDPQPGLAQRPLYWEFHEEQFAQAIRMGKWKAVRQNPEEPTELYDLSIDPGEQVNRAAQQPELVAQMEELFITLRRPSPVWTTAIDDAVPPGQLPAYKGGWLPLNETEGARAHDHSGLLGEAALHNFPSNPWSSDATGGFLPFNGTSQYLATINQTGPGGAAPRTTAAWIQTGEPGAIFSWGSRDGPGQAWVMRIDPETTTLRLEVQSGYVVGATSLTDSQWRHVAAVFDPAQDGGSLDGVRLYVDGLRESVASSQAQAIDTAPGTPIWIGGENGRDDLFFPGKMRHVQWFPVALSDETVAALADPALGHGARWHRTHFPDTEPDWDAPAPGSGIPVAFHYVAGQNPRDPLAAPLRAAPDPGGALRLSAPRDPHADVNLIPESAVNLLGGWNSDETHFEPVAAPSGEVAWRTFPAPAAPLFVRLRVIVSN